MEYDLIKKPCAVWYKGEVIGYVTLTEEERDSLNEDSPVYFGFDRETNPEMYQ